MNVSGKKAIRGIAIIAISAMIVSVITACASMTVVDVEWDTLEGPSKARQFLGISTSEVRVFATFKNGDRRTTRVGSIRYNRDVLGPQKVTVSVDKITGGSFDTEVMELFDIRIENQPNKVSYFVGDTIVLSGLKVMGRWNEMPDAEIPNSQLRIASDFSTVGKKDVNINYNGKTAMFSVTVEEKPVVLPTPEPEPVNVAQTPAPASVQTPAPATTPRQPSAQTPQRPGPGPASAAAPAAVPQVQPGLYFKAPPILPTDTPIAGIEPNDIEAAVNYFRADSTPVGQYTLLIDRDTTTGSGTRSVAKRNRSLTIIGLGGERTITLGSTGAVAFSIDSDATLTLGANITLRGVQGSNHSNSLVAVTGGRFIMLEGSKITGYTSTNYLASPVRVSGTNTSFTMEGGEISGTSNNTSSAITFRSHAAVYVGTNSTFTMTGGRITGNNVTANAPGGNAGGVFVDQAGSFTMTGGAITGNTRRNEAVDVVIANNANTINITGGTIGVLDNRKTPAASASAPAATTAAAAGSQPQAGLYLKAPPILPTDTPIAGIAANDIAAAIRRFNEANTSSTSYDGAYTLLINQDVTLTEQYNLTRVNRQLTIIGIGQERTITGSPAGSFRFNTRDIVLTLGENITIKGSSAQPTNHLISVSLGSTLIMKAGSKITGFKSTTGTSAPVMVGSIFIMDGGEISGNSVSIGNVGTSAGVLLTSQAVFTMNGGIITNNTMIDTTRNGNGGGVGFQSSGQASDIILNMNGGTITGNTRNGQPMDVHIPDNARNILNYNGGTIGAVFNKTGAVAPRP